MAFEIETIELSLKNPDTGRYLEANTYLVDGVTNDDGSLRPLSIGQLVMAVCLQRASELEAKIIDMMDDMNDTSTNLMSLTQIESDIVNTTSGTVNLNGKYINYASEVDGTHITTSVSYKTFLQNIGVSDVPDTANADSETLINSIESQMDSMNSFSQQSMIELQSLTNKRDQSYDMISNILKSINNQLMGNVNNY